MRFMFLRQLLLLLLRLSQHQFEYVDLAVDL